MLDDAPGAVQLLSAARATMMHSLLMEVLEEPLGQGPALIDFLRASMAWLDREIVRVLFLDTGNRLIRDEIMAVGSSRSAPVHHQEILRRALVLDAAALLLVHNHPAGDPSPSAADRRATRKLAAGAATLGIAFHDHLIVARSGWVSFRAKGLLEAG